jgi:hypothetical protein
MKSLVAFEVVKYMNNSSDSGRKLPNGIRVAFGLKSWSDAILDLGLGVYGYPQDIGSRSADWLIFDNCSKMASVSEIFFLGLHLATLLG